MGSSRGRLTARVYPGLSPPPPTPHTPRPILFVPLPWHLACRPVGNTTPTSPCDQQRDKERESVAMSEVLVVNQMTWPELARQCIVANVRSCGGGGMCWPVRGEGWACGTTRLIPFLRPAEQEVTC